MCIYIIAPLGDTACDSLHGYCTVLYCTVPHSTRYSTVVLLYCVLYYLFEEEVGLEADFRAFFRLKSVTELLGTF